MIRATGEGITSVVPDQAGISVTIETRSAGAQEASQGNAAKVEAVLSRLRSILGQRAEIQTTGISLSPVQTFPRDGAPPQTVGYLASNTLRVTMNELSGAGRVIDAAVEAGATRVGGVTFGLRDPEPARAQALKLAAQRAKMQVEAIASGLNVRVGAVVRAEESAQVFGVPADRFGAAAGAPSATTPVEGGLVEIRANVLLEMEILQ